MAATKAKKREEKQLSIRQFIGLGLRFSADSKGEFIMCQFGRVYAAQDKIGQHLVAVLDLRKATPEAEYRFKKLRLPPKWKSEQEIACRAQPADLVDLLGALVPCRSAK